MHQRLEFKKIKNVTLSMTTFSTWRSMYDTVKIVFLQPCIMLMLIKVIIISQ